MAKKAYKREFRKMQTRNAMEKKRSYSRASGNAYKFLGNEYYSTADHLSYDDLSYLLNLPQPYIGKID